MKQIFSLRRLGLERTGLLAFFLVAITDIISVISIFIPGSPFLSWISDDEKHELTDKTETIINDNYQELKQDRQSNIAHVTLLMTGIILGRFGMLY